MNSRFFLIFSVVFVLAATFAGCKSSKQAASTPSSSPTPAAASMQPQATPSPLVAAEGKVGKASAPPPPLANMVPVKTLEVHLPAAFNENDIPLGQAVEFKLAGNAGQFLCINVFELYRVEVRPPNGGPALQWAGDSKGNWYYVLPQTGIYRVLYAPTRSADIKFSFLAADDPITDPGIKPEQFSIDFGTITKQQFSIVPYSFDDGEDFLESWPTHLAVAGNTFEFRVMTVAGYKKMFEKYQRMDNLAAVLNSGGTQLKMNKDSAYSVPYYAIPYAAYKGAGMDMTARRQSLNGDGWRGLRWIGAFGQDTACKPYLAYIFEGISNDGRYFVLMRADIRNSAAEHQFEQQCSVVITEGSDPRGNVIFEHVMAAADAASFQPSLDELDAVIHSLKFH
jgi:hypothetical protein